MGEYDTRITYDWRPGHFAGCRIIESDRMVDLVEDWSAVRSPGRARRRRRQGHRQNIVVRLVPKREALQLPNGDIVMHPARVAELQRKMAESTRRLVDRMTEDLIYGRNTPGGPR